ncbi:GumC domain-containing protein [Cupriavidus nantongensis]|uniref:hypothetical protein n=1 Tax=Cupriavidus nantongensis TaxID=1796606 RepID=UPI0022482A32|nr:hypothetical protein [Cupriavidus nantongensis]
MGNKDSASQASELDALVVLVRSIRSWVNTRRKQLLWLVPLISAVVFFLLFQILCRYQSEGFLRATRKLTEYNTQRASFADKNTLSQYLQVSKGADDPNAQYLLRALDAPFLQTHVEVVLPYSKADLKYLTDIKNPVDPNLVGFLIRFAADTPADAVARVKLMGDYLKDTMLQQDLEEAIHQRAGEVKAKQQKIDNQLIKKRLEVEEATGKLNALKAIAAKYPETGKLESRQLLASDVSSSKYLSPVMQLVGVESELADLRIELASLERDAAQNELAHRFYVAAEELGPSVKSGQALLDSFQALRAKVFKDRVLDDDQVREVYNGIGLVIEEMRTKHLVNARFVSGPTLPDRRSGPRRAMLLILALFSGCVLAAAGVFAWEWVRKVKSKFVANRFRKAGLQA